MDVWAGGLIAWAFQAGGLMRQIESRGSADWAVPGMVMSARCCLRLLGLSLGQEAELTVPDVPFSLSWRAVNAS